MVCRLVAGIESIEAGAVHLEDIQPSVIVVIEQTDAPARGFDDVLLSPDSSNDRLGGQAHSRGNVDIVRYRRPRFELFCQTETPGRTSSCGKRGKAARR